MEFGETCENILVQTCRKHSVVSWKGHCQCGENCTWNYLGLTFVWYGKNEF